MKAQFKLLLSNSIKIKFATFFLIGFSILTFDLHANWKPVAAHLEESGLESIMIRSDQNISNTINLEYTIPSPDFKKVYYQNINNMPTQQMILGNAKIYSTPKEPEVPYIFSRVILPQGRTIDKINIIPLESMELPGKHTLSYGEMPHPMSSNTVTWMEPDLNIYNSDNPYPNEAVKLVSIQYRCGIAIAHINLFPVTYFPKSGKITYLKNFKLVITTKPSTNGGTGVKVRVDRLLKNYKMTEENPLMLNSYTSNKIQGKYQNVLCNPKDDYSYVVVTSKEFMEASTTPNINDLIEHRKSKGFTCKIETVEDILSNYSGSNKANKLRNFIKDAYNNWNTKFVLLGGDTAVVPLRTVVASNGGTTDNKMPSDLPLQCLDQETWNNDWEAEVYIGRFSAESTKEFANQIFKTLKYETDPVSEPYLTSHLGVGESLDANTYAKKAMQELQSYFPDEFSFDGIYDADGKWPKSELIDLINTSKYSILDHFGHCNTSYAMKMRNGDEEKLTNDNFIFAKSQGCIPGAFDRDCFGERLTTSTRTGMFAVVFNSRFGWYRPRNPTGGSSHKVHRSFWKACWEEDMDYFGEFNEYSHRMNTNYKWDIQTSNLLGDPATLFRGKDSPPFVQISSPKGREKWEQNRTFYIRWDDNIDDNVKIELLKGNSIYKVLATSVPSTGSFKWDITADYDIATDYKIKITSTITDTLVDESKEFFAIEPKSTLAVKWPNGGDALQKNSEYTITWDDNLGGNVKIDLYKTSKLSTNVVKSTESNGSFKWKVPENIKTGMDYKIRVSSIDKPWLFDESDNNISVSNPLVNLPYTQNFDSFSTDGFELGEFWEQLDDDDLDWTIQKGPTPSRVGSRPDETGAEGDHTSGDRKYLFTEASGNGNDKKMSIISPIFNFKNANSAKLSFYYHMFAKDDTTMGTLHVDICADGQWTDDVVKISGDQGDQWKEKVVDLANYIGKKQIQVRFRGETGSNWQSDICIDDFKIEATLGVNPNTNLLTNTFLKYFNSNIIYQIPNTISSNKIHVEINLYNLKGKLIKTLVNEQQKPGRYSVNLNLNNKRLATGIYIVKMNAKNLSRTIKMIRK